MDITPDIENLVRAAIEEDLGGIGDITSQLTISPTKKITVSMRARENGVLAGVDLAIYVFKTIDKDLNIISFKKDGDVLNKGDDIITIEGLAISILQAERIALNFLSHLSGIATETARYVQAVKHTKAQILDTRKTLPAYRNLHKHAVKMGGGTNHRMGLHDMILIKDNHIAAAGSVINALTLAQNSTHKVKIEIEVDTLDQLQDVLNHGGADIVMLDNMPPDMLKQAVKTINGKILTEASGGVTLNTVKEIAESGVDYISIGALTHSVRALDIGLDID